jgi:iron complex transport system ATP-binding protein
VTSDRRGRSALLEADRVHFAYGPAAVLTDVSVAVAAGTLTGILGPNGSGKTTLLRLFAGALAPRSGHVRLGDVDVTSLPRRALARQLAVVPQETQLAFDYTVLEVALMGRYPHLGAFEIEGPDDLAAALTALDATGTRSLADRPFRTLSGGEKQRVIIASALAQLDARGDLEARRPGARPVLLLDEPTASLDLRYQLEVSALLARLRDEHQVTVVLSTHDLRFAASVCTHLVLLSGGQVLAEGPPADVLTPDLVGGLYGIDAAVAAPLLR